MPRPRNSSSSALLRGDGGDPGVALLIEEQLQPPVEGHAHTFARMGVSSKSPHASQSDSFCQCGRVQRAVMSGDGQAVADTHGEIGRVIRAQAVIA